MFVHSSIDEAQLSSAAFRVYAHLCRREGKEGTSYPGIDSIAKTCALTKPTVIRSIRELEARNFVKCSRKTGVATVYEISDSSLWKEPTGKKEVTHQSKTGNATGKKEVTKGSPLKVLHEGSHSIQGAPSQAQEPQEFSPIQKPKREIESRPDAAAPTPQSPSPKRTLRFPHLTEESEFIAMLAEQGIDYDPERDGGFHAEMILANWHLPSGEAVACPLRLYMTRTKQ